MSELNGSKYVVDGKVNGFKRYALTVKMGVNDPVTFCANTKEQCEEMALSSGFHKDIDYSRIQEIIIIGAHKALEVTDE